MHATIEELDTQAKAVLAEYEGRELKAKDRLQIPQQEMPSQEPQVRKIGRAHV